MLATSSRSSSTVARTPASSASTRPVVISTTRKREGGFGAGAAGALRARSRGTNSGSGSRDSAARPGESSSSGTMFAPVPFVWVSRTQVFAISTTSLGPDGSVLRGRDEAEEDLGEALARVDRREVAGALEELDLDAPAGVAVALEHVADLGHHRLRREHVLARPARNRAHLAERPDLPRRAVGDNDVGGPVDPEHRRLRVEAGDARPVAVLRRERVEEAARAGRDRGPVLRRRQVARVAVVAGLRLEDLVEQQVLARPRLAVVR